MHAPQAGADMASAPWLAAISGPAAALTMGAVTGVWAMATAGSAGRMGVLGGMAAAPGTIATTTGVVVFSAGATVPAAAWFS